MKTLDTINQKIIELYKNGDEKRRVLYQTLKSELLSAAKNKKEDLTESEEANVLKKELKMRNEALTQFESASRVDLIEKSKMEIAEIKALLPEDLSADEIRKTVKSAIESSEDKNFGEIMKLAMLELKGKADGKTVSEIVKEELEK